MTALKTAGPVPVKTVSSLGSALEAAFQRFPNELALIEADRDRENTKLTYANVAKQAGTLAHHFVQAGVQPGDRVAIVMSNQSKWHVAAVAAFQVGAVLVPLDFKLAGAEHVRLLNHSSARVLVTEFHLWRFMAFAQREGAFLSAETVFLTERPPKAVLEDAPQNVMNWPEAVATGPEFAPRERDDPACIVYSSGTGGRPKGCVLSHGAYLRQFEALTELHPFGPGVRYLSILPTNHAIDFMVGFLGPYLCGATVVHLRTLRPEFIREAFSRYGITHMALVPMILKNLETALRARIDELPPMRRVAFRAAKALLGALSGGRPNARLGRRLLAPVHAGFGGRFEMFFVGGAYTEPETLTFFHDLGIPVANGYGLTEGGTALTLDRLDPPAPATVGEPLPGVEVEIRNQGSDGVGEIVARGSTLMQGYYQDSKLTDETIVEGWLLTGDLGRIVNGRLQIVGRRKNMIVTEGGKNIYPEDVELAFVGLPAKELCVFAEHFLWTRDRDRGERLILVIHPEEDQPVDALLSEIGARTKKLLDYQRPAAALIWKEDFPRTASLKIKRVDLAKLLAEFPYEELVSIP